MGLRRTITAFKGIDRAQFRAAFEEVVVRHGGQVTWDSTAQKADEDVRMAHCGTVHAMYLAYPFDYLIARNRLDHENQHDPGRYAGGSQQYPTEPSTATLRTFRGGSWDRPPARCRSAARGGNAPTFRNFILGFRVALHP